MAAMMTRNLPGETQDQANKRIASSMSLEQLNAPMAAQGYPPGYLEALAARKTQLESTSLQQFTTPPNTAVQPAVQPAVNKGYDSRANEAASKMSLEDIRAYQAGEAGPGMYPPYFKEAVTARKAQLEATANPTMPMDRYTDDFITGAGGIKAPSSPQPVGSSNMTPMQDKLDKINQELADLYAMDQSDPATVKAIADKTKEQQAAGAQKLLQFVLRNPMS